MKKFMTPERIDILPFSKPLREPWLDWFEQAYLYGLVQKMTLLDGLKIKDYATREARFGSGTSYARTQDELDNWAAANGSRFLLTGSFMPTMDEPETTVEEVRVTLRLYDALEKRYLSDDVATFRFLEPNQLPFSTPTIAMGGFNTVLNETVLKLSREILPDTWQPQSNLVAGHALTASLEAFRLLLQAEAMSDAKAEERIPLLEAATRLDPAMESAYNQLGKLHKSQKDYQKSVANYKKALEVSSASKRVKSQYAIDAGIGCALIGQYDLAIRWWLAAIELEPTVINPYMNVAHAYEEREDYAQAEAYFLKAQGIAPEDPRTYYSLARIYSKTGAWRQAVTQYLHQLATDDSDPWCHSNIATCYLQLGETQNAVRHLEKTAALDPDGEAGQYAQLILMGLAPA